MRGATPRHGTKMFNSKTKQKMTDKLFSVPVLIVSTPLAIGATIAIFFNPVHIFTAAAMWSMVRASLYEPDNDGENLITALRRVFAHGVGGKL